MDQGTAQDFIEDLMQQIQGLEERFRAVEANFETVSKTCAK